MRPPAIVSWSGGKDCALALHRAKQTHEIRALVTTVTEPFDRISMHGVRGELLRAQAAAIDVPLVEVAIPYPCPNEIYETRMCDALRESASQKTPYVICGDLFLQDVRRYREERLFQSTGCQGVFPLWGENTLRLAREFIDLGFRAILCCVDTTVLSAEFAGREFGAALLADLPKTVDPCGENGEFHTFVFDGPLFRKPLAIATGVRELREGRFQYVDLVPK